MSTSSLAETEFNWSPTTGNVDDSTKMRARNARRNRGVAVQRREQADDLNRIISWSDEVAGFPPANPFEPLETWEIPSDRPAQPHKDRRARRDPGAKIDIPASGESQPSPQIIVLDSESSDSEADDPRSYYGVVNSRTSRSRHPATISSQSLRQSSPHSATRSREIYTSPSREREVVRAQLDSPRASAWDGGSVVYARPAREAKPRPPSPSPTIILPFSASNEAIPRNSNTPKYEAPASSIPFASGLDSIENVVRNRRANSHLNGGWDIGFQSAPASRFSAHPSGNSPVMSQGRSPITFERPVEPLPYLPLPQPPFGTLPFQPGPVHYAETPPPLFMPPPPPLSNVSLSSRQTQHLHRIKSGTESPPAMSIATASLPGIASPPPSITYRGYQESLQ